MKKIYSLILLFLIVNSLLFSSVILSSDNPNVTDKNATLNIKLEVVQGFNGTQSAILRVRPVEKLSFASYKMTRGTEANPVYTYQLDDLSKFGKGFDYYFEVILVDGTKISLPEYQPSINPFRVEIEDNLDYNPSIIKMSPDTKYISKDNFVIALSFYALKDKIDKKSIQLFLDGENITNKSKLYSDMIVAKIKSPRKGTHRFYLKAKLNNGKKIKSRMYESTVETKQFTLPFELDSSLQIGHFGYLTKTDSTSNNQSQTNFRFRSELNKDWFGFKSNIYLSSLQRAYKQNINRFMFDFYVPSFDLILGDYSPEMGDLVMVNSNVRGVSGDFHFKNFKLRMTSGSLKKAIDGDETTVNDTTVTYSAGNFRQTNLSAYMQVGSDNGFSWGLSFAKNKDQISSLDEKYYRYIKTVHDTIINPDSTFTDTTYTDTTYMVTPQDNFVFGSNIRLSLFQRRIDMGMEAAMSVYNPNIIGGALSKDEITSQYANVNLPIDPKDFESIYVYNLNSQPLKPGKANIAYKFYFRTLFFRNYLNFSYSSIGSAYKSLTATSLVQDTKTISVFDNFNYIRYLNVNMGMRISQDNVDNTKDNTNQVVNYSFGANYNSPDYPSLSVMFQNTKAKFDSTFENGTNYFLMSTGYQFGNIPKVPSKLSISFSNFDNKLSKDTDISTNKKVIGFRTKTYFEDLPLVTSMNFDFGLEEKEEIKDRYFVFLIRNQVKLLEDRLKPYFIFSTKSFNGDSDSQKVTILRLGSNYNFYQNTNLSTDFGYVNYKNNKNETDKNSSFNWNLRLTYKF